MIRIGHASLGESGANNQVAGDQTGKEVCIRNWYSKPWDYLIRAKKPQIGDKIAQACEKACNNNLIGYDQTNRNDIITYGELVEWDFSKIDTPIECDCSSLVSACLIASGVDKSVVFKNGNACTTRTLREALLDTMDFKVLSADKYVKSDENLKRGDILLKEGSHVVIVLDDSKEVEKVDTTPSGVEYFPQYKGYSPSIVTALTEIGCTNVSKAYRGKIAKANGIVDNENWFTGSAEQNTALLNKLKEGTLIKP